MAGGPAVTFTSPGKVTGPTEPHLFLHLALPPLTPSPRVPLAKFDLIWRDLPGSPLLRAQWPPRPSSLLSLGFKSLFALSIHSKTNQIKALPRMLPPLPRPASPPHPLAGFGSQL